MIKAIPQVMTPALKWLAVIMATAVVVLSVQVEADSQSQPAVNWTPASGFADLIEIVSPAVVHVAISGTTKAAQGMPDFNFPPGSPFEEFFEQYRKQQPKTPQKKRPLGIGSGFVISADGYVVTNHHVIKDADEIVVTMTNGDEYQAELKGSDSKTDLALLKLKKAKDLPFVKWGDDDKSRVGDWVLAIGNPFGLGGTATTGIISARGRDIRSGPYDDYIQVDAAINRGNSGGPLFNLTGEVIGINTAIYSPNGGSVGIGFAIPSNMAHGVINQLKETGEVERAWIGVQIQSLTDELAEGFGRDNDYGALVSSVMAGKPADKAGIKAGDIILSFNGEEIQKMRDLPRLVAATQVGKKSRITVWRNGAEKKMMITADRYPDDGALAAAAGQYPEEATSDDEFGAELAVLTDEHRSQFGIDGEVDGVVVLKVYPQGMAAENGLQSGDVLVSFGGKPVKTPKQVLELIAKSGKQGRSKVVLLLQRQDNSRFIPFNLDVE